MWLLYSRSQWTEGLIAGVGVTAIFAAFAFTRIRWDAHFDMFLAMLGPGGLGMILGAGRDGCHGGSLLGMSAGMLIASVPLCWFQARCLIEARRQRHGIVALSLDVLGMEAGMVLGSLPGSFIPMGNPRVVWLHHGLMLVGMSLGMLAAWLLWTGTMRRLPKDLRTVPI